MWMRVCVGGGGNRVYGSGCGFEEEDESSDNCTLPVNICLSHYVCDTLFFRVLFYKVIYAAFE